MQLCVPIFFKPHNLDPTLTEDWLNSAQPLLSGSHVLIPPAPFFGSHVLIPPAPFSADAKKGELYCCITDHSPSLRKQRGGKEGGEYILWITCTQPPAPFKFFMYSSPRPPFSADAKKGEQILHNLVIPPLCASREGESLSKAKEGGEYMHLQQRGGKEGGEYMNL